MPSIGKDKIVNMGGGMNYINADCLGACNGNPETNLFNATQFNFGQCIDNGDGTYTSNIIDNYYCRATSYELNNIVLNSLGKKIIFSMNESLTDKRMSIVINGNRTNGTTYQEIGGSIGTYNSIFDIIANDFTTITSIEVRWNRKNSKFTDTTTVVSGFKLVIEEA